MKYLKNIIPILGVCLIFSGVAFAYDLDLSVNQEIEKKYDSDKLNQDMKVNNVNSNKTAPKSTPVFDNTSPVISKTATFTKIAENNGIKIPSGTKFQVKSNASVSNWSGVNTLLTFTSTAPVYKTYITIPVGTTFKGVVALSRGAQIAGNGGLLEIKITSMQLNGKTIPVEGKITKANSKNIYFNKIKGARQYLAGVDKKINQGINFYKKARNISTKISSNPVGTILSPIPTITGAAGSVLCTVASPITGLIQKGKNISLPSGTTYEIKLISDAYVN